MTKRKCSFSRRIARSLYKFTRSELRRIVKLEFIRCDSENDKGNKCIKQVNHLLWHNDAWNGWWWD